jgi:hypothetical protein
MKVGVWCAVSARIAGTVFLTNFFPELREEERLYGWFQQDPAAAHTMHALSDVFRDRIISSGICPASSPYLNPSDFFF